MKRLIKGLLLLLGAVVRFNRAPKVVFYHDIGTAYTPMGTPTNVFWKHMAILNEDRKKGIVHQVCFDDGFRGVWDEREHLRSAGIVPKVFIAVRLVGTPGYLTWDEIRTLKRDYGFDFQSHTWSHQTLAGPMIDESPIEERTEEWFNRELAGSRTELTQRLGCEVDELCFPAGYFSDELIERCRRAGYRRLYSCLPGDITDDYMQSRNLVQDLTPFEFRLTLCGGMNILRNHFIRRHCVR